MITYFVVQSFQSGHRGYLIPDEPLETRSEMQARSWAVRMAAERVGVIAFARTGDPATGEWADAEILCQFGVVPDYSIEAAS